MECYAVVPERDYLLDFWTLDIVDVLYDRCIMPLIVKVRLMLTLIENNTVFVIFSAVHFSR